MTDKKVTGYPSIDKPWLKYYSEEAIHASLPECTIYEYLWKNNKNHLDDIALDYFRRKITYKELFKEIDRAAKAFISIGIKSGDIVPIISIATPEIIYSFYALNRIGAVTNRIDLRKPSDEILDTIADCHSSVCLIFDEVDSLLWSNMLSAGYQCILVSIADTLPFPKNVLYKAKRLNTVQSAKKGSIISWHEFLSYANSCVKINDSCRTDDLAILEHTGGTTGISKAVMLTNKNVNSVVAQYRMGGTPLSRQEKWLSIGFPFIAYTLVCSIHLPLSLGITGVLCFDIDVPKIKTTVQKYKCNHMSNVPTTWEKLTLDINEKIDYSFLKNPVVGADTLQPAKEVEINTFLKQHGAKCEISKGYGMTEVCSAVSVCAPSYNKIGSVGIPFLNTVIAIFDPDTGEELSYNELGEVCICGPSVMLGYFNQAVETHKVLKCHKDGKLWMHSGDLGHMDTDGFLYIDGRIKRMLVDHMGFKIFSPQVEQVLSRCACVDKCCVVGVSDPNYAVGQIAIAYIVVKQNMADAVKEIQQMCANLLPEHSIPQKYIIVNELPYTPAGKVDFRALERMAAEMENRDD